MTIYKVDNGLIFCISLSFYGGWYPWFSEGLQKYSNFYSLKNDLELLVKCKIRKYNGFLP